MGKAKPLRLRLFLEGLEVPVVSANVQVNMWAPATAAIQIVPLDEAFDFKPRTMVHLFFLEEPRVYDTNKRVDISSGMENALNDSVYKLLFCGEIAGFSFVKTPMSRAVILQCLDHSSYWDQLQATMMDYGPQGNAWASKSAFYGSDPSLFANVPGSNQIERLRSWICGKPTINSGWSGVAGLAGGILNMMEQMSGGTNQRLGVNDFYSIAELRCHILAQVSAEENDDTSQRLLDVKVFFDWLSNSMQNLPGQVSLRDMIKLLCQYIYYQIAPNPAAKYDPPDGAPKTKTWGPKVVSLTTHPLYGASTNTAQAAMTLLNPDNTGIQRSEVVTMQNDITKMNANLSKMREYLEVSTLNAARALEAHVVSALNNWERIGRSGVGPDEYLKAAWKQAEIVFKELKAVGQYRNYTKPGGSATIEPRARLRTQIFRPDCFMAAPPTCNVIFPEQYSQMTYDRNFIGEVTRVEISLYSMIVGRDALTASRFMEPQLRGAAEEVIKHISHKWRVLMDHELHTGIIGREEWLPDSFNVRKNPVQVDATASSVGRLNWVARTGLHHFFKYRIGPRTMTVAGRFMPNIVCGFPSLVIQKPFPLESLPGDPSEAIDKILHSNNPAVELHAPPQFLGMVEGFSHSIGQDGASTTISMSHCRNHLGIDDEFVGKTLDKERRSGSLTSSVYTQLRYSEVVGDKKRLDFLKRCTPQSQAVASMESGGNKTTTLSYNDVQYVKKALKNGKPVSEAKNTTVTTSKTSQSKSSPLPYVVDAQDPFETTGKTIKVPAANGDLTVGGVGPQGGRIKLIEVLSPYEMRLVDGKYYYENIIVYENKSQSVALDSPIPVETVVRPGWLSTSYDNERVGPTVYSHFFGCNSIVDAISLSDIESIPERPDDKGVYVSWKEDRKELEARLIDHNNVRNFYSIEKAVNLIAYLYSRVKTNGTTDIDEFVSTYTWRPIATRAEVLGSSDLRLVVNGTKVEKEPGSSGTIGFHTLSVHEVPVSKGRLTGLLDDPNKTFRRMNQSQLESIKLSYDVRKEKWDKVKNYVDALGRGLRGYQG